MESIHKCVMVFSAWILWVFGLTTVLAWTTFGYFDLEVVREIALLLLPLMAVSVGALIWSERSARSDAAEKQAETTQEEQQTSEGVRRVDAH